MTETPTNTGAVEAEFVLVPREPTEEMAFAAASAPLSDEAKAATNSLDRMLASTKSIYRAMIAAAPTPAEPDDLEDERKRHRLLWAAMSSLSGYGLPNEPRTAFVNVVNGDLLDLRELAHAIPCPTHAEIGATVEEEVFAFLTRKYVQRADDRQKAMGLKYTTAETHDLAKGITELFSRLSTGGAGREVVDVAKVFLAGYRFTETGYGQHDVDGAFGAYLNGVIPGEDDEFAADLDRLRAALSAAGRADR